MQTRTITLTVATPSATVFNFLADIENLPHWSGGFCEWIELHREGWWAYTALGELEVASKVDDIAGAIDLRFAHTAGWKLVIPVRVRTDGDPRGIIDELANRLATGTMFGAGTLAILSSAGPLVKRNADRDALIAAIGLIADGNGLVVAEETDSGKKDPPSKVVSEAIRAAGGTVRPFAAPKEGGLAAWVEARARERGIPLGQGAAKELAIYSIKLHYLFLLQELF